MLLAPYCKSAWDALKMLPKPTSLPSSSIRKPEANRDACGALHGSKQYFQRAVTMHGELLRLDPYRAESYQSLRALYTGVKRADESWCLCQALCALKMAGPEEREFFKKHRKKTAAECTDFFSEEHWFNHVLHPDQDPLLTGIFATIAPAIAAERAQGLAHFGLSASDLREPKSDKAAISQTLSYVAGVTQIELPEVYANQGDTGGLSVLLTENPSIGLGKAALAGGPAQALAFLGGRHLSYFRNGHVTR